MPAYLFLTNPKPKIKNPKSYIAFDLGAESGRCMVGQFGGGRLALHEVHRFPTHHGRLGERLLWDILAIFGEVKTGLREAARRFGPSFAGISVDTWGVDYVLLDADGRLLGYPHHYRDSRTDGVMEATWETVPREAIYRQTGIQFMPFNTLYQLRAEQQQSLDLLTMADKLLLMPDYLLYLLCGVRRAEYSIASTTQLTDPHQRNWAWDLMDQLGLPRTLFPAMIEPGIPLGVLLPELAEEVGLDTTIPVIAGAGHDTAAAVAAVPALENDWAYLSSGSWSLMGVERDEPLINDATLGGNFTNEGGVAGTIRFLKNIAGLWLVQACRRVWAAQGQDLEYADLARLAAEQPPTHAWVDPDDPRFLQPGDMPGRVRAFLQETGQAYQEDIGWVVRCVLESLAFKYRHVFKQLERLTGRRLERLHAVGGGIQNTVLCQMTADAIGKTVIAGPVEGTVIGNLGMQAIATGHLDGLHALRELVARSFAVQTYQPNNTAYWDEHEAAFQALVVS